MAGPRGHTAVGGSPLHLNERSCPRCYKTLSCLFLATPVKMQNHSRTVRIEETSSRRVCFWSLVQGHKAKRAEEGWARPVLSTQHTSSSFCLSRCSLGFMWPGGLWGLWCETSGEELFICPLRKYSDAFIALSCWV